MGNRTCPLCGAEMKKEKEIYTIQDAEICMHCADDLRFRYPVEYLAKYRKLADLAALPGCGELRQKDLRFLRDHMKETIRFSGGDSRTAAYRVDRMQLLTLEEFREQLVSADAAEDAIRMEYQDYTNVFTVDYARALYRPIGKNGIQNVRKKRKGFCAAGYIRAGQFQEGDMVAIIHGGRLYYADIIGLDYEDCTISEDGIEERTGDAEGIGDRGNQGCSIRAGYQVTLVLNEKAKGIEAGDWIVSD